MLKNWKQLGLTGLLLLLVATLESKSALGAYGSVADHVSGLQHAALSASCAVLAFVFSTLAGRFKFDIRPAVRSSATLARLVSIAFLIVPTTYLGASLKLDRVERQWTAYYGSEAYLTDVEVTRDPMADRYDRQDARARIIKPTGEVQITDGEWMIALALQVLIITAAGIPMHAPATAEEIAHWRRVEAAQKGVATRKRNAKVKAAKAKKPKLRLVG